MKIISENGLSKILLKNDLIGYAVRTKENPYLYEFEIPKSEKVFVTNLLKKSNWSLWHRRLGHLSSSYLS